MFKSVEFDFKKTHLYLILSKTIKMKIKYLSILFFILCLSKVAAQAILFDEFYFEMPLSEAKKILKKNQKALTNIAFGAKTAYAVRKKSLVKEDDILISLNLWSKNNLTLKQAEKYLIDARAHFEANKYKTVYAQENWSKPLLVKKNLPCIRFVDPDKKTVVEIDPRGQGSVFNIFVTYYNYDWFLKKARGEK